MVVLSNSGGTVGLGVAGCASTEFIEPTLTVTVGESATQSERTVATTLTVGSDGLAEQDLFVIKAAIDVAAVHDLDEIPIPDDLLIVLYVKRLTDEGSSVTEVGVLTYGEFTDLLKGVSRSTVLVDGRPTDDVPGDLCRVSA